MRRPSRSRILCSAVPLLLCLPLLAAGCGSEDHGPGPAAGATLPLSFTLVDGSVEEGNRCLALADGVAIDIVPGPDFGPFWREPGSRKLVLPALTVPIGETGSAIVNVHVLGYISAAPPPGGLPISRGDLYGLELKASGSGAVSIRMVCTDNDGDGLLDIEEDCNLNGRLDTDVPHCAGGTLYETDPRLWDTDGGGVSDGDERERLTDPLDPTDDLVLYGMSPRVVYPGDEVTISGRGFSRSLYDNEVRFGGTVAQNLSVDENLRVLTVRVPEGVEGPSRDERSEAGWSRALRETASDDARGDGAQQAVAGSPAPGMFQPLTLVVSRLESAPLHYVPGGTVLAVIPVGDSPNNLLFSPEGGRVYVVNHGSGDLSVVDLELLKERTGPSGAAGRIPLGLDPIALDISRDGRTLYVANRLSDDVTPVDCFALDAAGPNIRVGPEPWDLVMLPERDRAYVVNYGAHVRGVVSVLDTAAHRRLMDIDFPFDIVTSARGVEIVLTPDGTRAWLVHEPEHHIYKIDTATDQVRWGETVLNACNEGRKLAFSPDGTFAYLVGAGLVPGGFTLLSEVPVRPSWVWLDDSDCFPVRILPMARDLVVTPDGRRLYVGSHSSVCEDVECNLGEVFAVDLAARRGAAVLNTYSVTDLAVSPDGRRLYAADIVQDVVHVLDTATDTVVAVADVMGDMVWPGTAADLQLEQRGHLERRRMALSPDGSRLVTVNALTNDVSVLAAGDPVPFLHTTVPLTAALENVGRYGHCCDPILAAFSPDGTRAYVTAHETHNLQILDTRTHRVMQIVDLRSFIGDRGEGECPKISRLAVSPDGASVYVWVTKYLGCNLPWEDLLARVDANTGAITAALWTGTTTWHHDLIHPHPDGGKLYFLNIGRGRVWVLDPVTLERTATVPVPAISMLFHPTDPARAYLVQERAIVLMDTRTDTLVDADGDPATTGPGLPAGISGIEAGEENHLFRPRFSPDGRRLYAVDGREHPAAFLSDEILVVDLDADRLVHAFRPRGRPLDLMPCPAGRKLYVIVGGSPEVQIYDTRTFQFVGRIPVGSELLSLTLTPDERWLLAATRTDLFAIDVASDRVVASIPVCGWRETVETVAVSPDASLAYVTYNPRPISGADRSQAGVRVVRLPAPLEAGWPRLP